MLNSHDDDDAALNLAERRFFAALAAARTLQGECEILHEVMILAEQAWRGARARTANLESLRDALGKQLAELTWQQTPRAQLIDKRMVMSAA
jgi:hypothetical protein